MLLEHWFDPKFTLVASRAFSLVWNVKYATATLLLSAFQSNATFSKRVESTLKWGVQVFFLTVMKIQISDNDN